MGSNSLEDQICLFFAGDDFQFAFCLGNSLIEFGTVGGFAGGAGGEDAEGCGAEFAGLIGELADDVGGFVDAVGLKDARFEHALAKPGLFASLQDGRDDSIMLVGDEDFDGIAADIDDGAAVLGLVFCGCVH